MNEIIIIILLILLNGVFALSEIAMISVRKAKLAKDAKKGSKGAQYALRLANEPDRLLSTVQVGITSIGILTGIYSGATLADDCAYILSDFGVQEAYARPLAQTLIIIAVTYLTLVFGELLPKRIGMNIADKASKALARPMYLLSVIAMPFVWILSKSTHLLIRLIGVNSESGKVTEEEIRTMIQESASDGEIKEVEQDIVERVFFLGDRNVSSIMTHRSELIVLEKGMNADQVRERIKNQLYEVYPIVERSLDNVIGVILLKDLFFELSKEDFSLDAIIHTVHFFHEEMDVYSALAQMKEKKTSHALICDEFGVCQGMITLKDIFQGLIGEMNDEQSEPDIVKRKDKDEWLVDGQCSFFEFLLYFDREEDYAQHNYNTISGLILKQTERIPTTGETITWNNFQFEIIDMDGARIDKILVTTI